MHIELPVGQMQEIAAHLEAAYPNEGAGFLLGKVNADKVRVEAVLPVENKREAEAQHNRYVLEPRDFMKAELAADEKDLSIVGIFHSHPDHPSKPSQFDLEHALPNFTYFITSVLKGKAAETQAWRMRDDRTAFDEDTLIIS